MKLLEFSDYTFNKHMAKKDVFDIIYFQLQNASSKVYC